VVGEHRPWRNAVERIRRILVVFPDEDPPPYPDLAFISDDAARANVQQDIRAAIDPAKPCKGFGDNTLWIITEGDRSATPSSCRANLTRPGPCASSGRPAAPYPIVVATCVSGWNETASGTGRPASGCQSRIGPRPGRVAIQEAKSDGSSVCTRARTSAGVSSAAAANCSAGTVNLSSMELRETRSVEWRPATGMITRPSPRQ
jgi:hypothetical protein